LSSLLPFIITGLVSGSVYGLSGVGLVLTYKTSGIFNFAYGALATAAAYIFYMLNVQHGWPLWLALVVSVPVLGVLLGFGFERFAERVSKVRLANQIGATVGLYLITVSGATLLFGSSPLSFPDYLVPNHSMKIAGVNVQVAQVVIFAISIVATGSLYLFLRQSRLGTAMRAVVDNHELTNLAGNNPAKIRRWAWVIGCLFATLSGLLLAPSVQLDPTTLTLLVVQAFGAAALGGFSSLPLTWAGGLVVGILSSVLTKYVNSSSPIAAGIVPSLPFIVLFLAILFYPRRRLFIKPVALAREAVNSWRAPTQFQVLGGVLVVAFLVLVPSFASIHIDGWSIGLTYVILLLSLGLLVRTSGHISLCHATFAAIGAVAFSRLTLSAHLPWVVALVVAGLIVVPIGALVAIPAIRLGGLFLALATFGLGLLVEDMFYQSSWMFGEANIGVVDPRPSPSWLNSDTGTYYLILVVTVVVALLVVLIVRSRLGRLLRGLADSPAALNANGTTVNVTHTLVFCMSAFLAAVAGALFGVALGSANGISFDPITSLTYLALIVISVGGEPWYALLAGAGVGIIPVYLTASNVSTYLQLIFGFFAVQVGLFGTQPLPESARRAIDRFGRWGRRPLPAAGHRPEQVVPSAPVVARSRARQPVAQSLEIAGLTVRFGGLVAVDGLSLRAEVGRVTGLIGPNGAGKTTTFNAATGFNRPSAGRITINGGQQISRLSPAARARLGIGRSFQQMELFDSLTVRQNVAMGREASLAGANPLSQTVARKAEREEVRALALDSIEFCGIGHLADANVGALSTGQRRLVELARALAGPFSLLLLDEPSSGLDRAETREFGRILKRVMTEREVGILLVEHDMSLVMDICDYLYVMDFGRLIFEGTPTEVQASPDVQAAYLGSEDMEERGEAAAEQAAVGKALNSGEAVL
jgi:ABC-type branched-subunit amino acid transport system ATPase component/branched-subunit amino acid ABC-type transport system permease component